VVDCADRERVPMAAAEFRAISEDPLMRNSVLLVFANKQDMPGAMPPAELCEAFSLPQVGTQLCVCDSTIFEH
jgi:ADP-ribosylation factor 1/2